MSAAQQVAGALITTGVSSTSLHSELCGDPSSATSAPINDLDVIKDMIAISAERLEGLRTQCATSATLTQQEIRSLETKLVRMFSELLLTKARLNERIPAHTTGNELRQWLLVVGLSQESLNVCLSRLSSLEQLLEQSDEELKQMLTNNPSYREEEVRRLTKAMQNLRKCHASLSQNADCPSAKHAVPSLAAAATKLDLSEQLFWDSWDYRQTHHHRGSMGNIGNFTSSPRMHRLNKHGIKQSRQQNMACTTYNRSSTNDICARSIKIPDELPSSLQGSSLTLTPSPPNSPLALGGGSLNGTPQRGVKLSSSSQRKQQLANSINSTAAKQNTPTHCISPQHPQRELEAVKSKCNEPQQDEGNTFIAGTNSPPMKCNSTNSTISTRSRLHTEPSPDSYSSASSDIFVENNNPNSLQVPRSPCTPLVTVGMGHTISHRFTKVFKMMSTCYLCQKQMFFGLKCKECKYRCHKDCEPNVPPSCGLPPEFVDEFKKTLSLGHASNATHQSSGTTHTSPNLTRIRTANKSGSATHYPDSSSPGSSCNSSSPSSPALFHMQHQHGAPHGSHSTHHGMMSSSGGGSSSTSSNMISTPSSFHLQPNQFNFPDVTITSNCNPSSNTKGSVSTTQTLYSSQAGLVNALDSVDLSSSITSTDYNSHDTISLKTAFDSNSAAAHAKNLPSSVSSTCAPAIISQQQQHQHHSHHQNNSSINSNHSSIVASSIISSTGTFYPRKLSSAGVDKRGPFSELSDTHKSNDSDKTVSLSGSTSTDSDRTPVRLDSTEDGDSGNWPRQNSLSLKEWDIPYGDLRLLEQIGKGRFGTVHRALWHGDVAVKLLKEDYLDDERMLEAFKLEVANFKKTRHENLVLFMGACMNPPYLAIVTSLCKGNTLYTYIHARRDKFTINKTTLVAQQISQGMGYLHARGIFHKDLRTKNIFLENGKVIITDFGLFSSTKLMYCDMGLGVPKEWLCYLAPELMRALMPRKPTDEILPFSKASDVYSFGTVWYELLCGEFPFKVQPPEAIIWQVGRGMKQTLANLQTSRDVKDILMFCWSFVSNDRPDFPKLLTLLERLPKKRLARSPSHPVQLSRSAESVF